jgi:dTDP-4-amino-4,6-dideoxy-D-galactose acyltransferase
MHINRLSWDSDFFGYEVGSANDYSHLEADNIALAQSPFTLIYLGLNQKIIDAPSHFFLADEKLVLSMDIGLANNFEEHANIQILTESSDRLVSLALQSGIYSRFKVDPNFKNNEFERLYKQWIVNALQPKPNQYVAGFFDKDSLAGFVSIAEKEGILHIGLIAVDAATRGNGIGAKLLQWVFAYAQKNGFKQVNVVTQAANAQALAFYEKNSFQIISRTYIYHVWKQH